MVQRIKILQPIAHRVEETNLNTSAAIVAQYLKRAISAPNVALKQGQKQKKCPNCGAEYFSAACPDCGYTNKTGNTTVVYANTATQPVKKRKTWLWVLGWIFIFPIPLTILMVRNQRLNKWVKIGIIAVAWILYLIIAFTGGGSTNS